MAVGHHADLIGMSAFSISCCCCVLVVIHVSPFLLTCLSFPYCSNTQPYVGTAVSAFQKFIRGSSPELHDHICKEMNELNLERCRCIPKNVPGADWRVLQEVVAADPSREKYKVGGGRGRKGRFS